MEWSPVYHVKGWGKFNRHYGDFCTGADIGHSRSLLALALWRPGVSFGANFGFFTLTLCSPMNHQLPRIKRPDNSFRVTFRVSQPLGVAPNCRCN